MRKKEHKARGLRSRVFFPMFFIVLLQLILISAIVFGSGMITQLDRNAMRMLGSNVELRRDALQEQLVMWSRIEEYCHRVERNTNISAQALMSDTQSRHNLISSSVPDIIELMRQSGTTGAFLILENSDGKNDKDAFYIRTHSPESANEDYSDLFAEAGAASILNKNSIAFDNLWSSRLTIENISDFFENPMQAARDNPTLSTQDLGFWSEPFRPHEQDMHVITYSAPVRDENGQPFGVVGIEVPLTRLADMMPSRELGIDAGGSYLLCVTRDGVNYSTVLAQGSYYQSHMQSGTVFSMAPDSRHGAYFTIVLEGLPKTYAARDPLTLYNTNTPFSGDIWMLCGLGRANVIERYSKHILAWFAASAIICSAGGIIGIWAMTSRMLRPIDRMMQSLTTHGAQDLVFEPTGIIEFDSLAGAIERLSVDIRRSSSKLNQIIAVSGIRLGLIEYEPDAAFVFCTKPVFELTEIEGSLRVQENYIERHMFLGCMKQLSRKLKQSEGNPDVYYMKTASGGERWLRIRVIQEGQKSICVMLDITSDILERQTIQRERDYDMLTDLLNRRAFSTRINALLSSGKVRAGIFSIWDLDNLKFLNDNYGHDMGDKYLRCMAEVLRGFPEHNSIVARMAGDEFTVFLYSEDENASEQGGELFSLLVMQHQRLMTRTFCAPDGESFCVSASVGTSAYPDDATTYEQLLKLADLAMYEVKNSTKGGVQRFERSVHLEEKMDEQCALELDRILKNQLADFAFQPIIRVSDGKVYGYEAYIRPRSKLLADPLSLLRVAAAENKLNQIEHFVWTHALKEFFARAQDEDLKICINSMPSQCMRASDFKKLEDDYGDKLRRVVVEASVGRKYDSLAMQRKGRWCAENGVKMSLDNFDSRVKLDLYAADGWRVSYVTLDSYMSRAISASSERKIMVRHMVEQCHEAGALVCASGIENEQDLACLVMLGVDFVQGSYFCSAQKELAHPSEQAVKSLLKLKSFISPTQIDDCDDEP